MKQLFKCLLIGFVLGAILFGCASTRQPGGDLVTSEPLTEAAPDSLAAPLRLDSVTVHPFRTALAKLLGREAPVERYVAPAMPAVIRTGKKSTVNAYYGPATVSTSTVGKKGSGAAGPHASSTRVEKPKGATSTGAGDATLQRGNEQAAATHGDGNEEILWRPAAPKQPSRLGRWLKVAGGVAAGLGAGWLFCSVLLALGATFPAWLVPLLWRRKSST